MCLTDTIDLEIQENLLGLVMMQSDFFLFKQMNPFQVKMQV